MNNSKSSFSLASINHFRISGLKTLEIESEMITYLHKTIDSESFEQACKLLFDCKGKVVCMGVGKSGHIASKISASFSSTGTNSIFIHPCEAGHGDIGVVTKDDIVLYVSNSGESYEFNIISSFLEANNIPIIAITNNIHSTLALKASIVLKLNVYKEACPLNLAPTATTTNTLVLGDCLVIALLEAKHFNLNDFSKSHPSGALGKRLLTTNKQIMRTGDKIPVVDSNMTVSQCLVPMSNKNLGCVLVLDQNNMDKCLGIFTDGDLRRVITKQVNLYEVKIKDVMSKSFIYSFENELAYTTLNVLKNKSITTIPIFNDQHHLCGIIHINDLLKYGL